MYNNAGFTTDVHFHLRVKYLLLSQHLSQQKFTTFQLIRYVRTWYCVWSVSLPFRSLHLSCTQALLSATIYPDFDPFKQVRQPLTFDICRKLSHTKLIFLCTQDEHTDGKYPPKDDLSYMG